MSSWTRLTRWWWFSALLAALGAGLAGAADARRPNILLILADDLGYSDLAFQGGKDIPTPHLDALAAAGVRCTSGYVSGPYCSPTRAGLLTGRYQTRFGHEFNPGPAPGPDVGLPLDETTLAAQLQAAGYRTGLVGKWHLGADRQFHPLERGFQEFFGFLGGAHSYFPGQAARGPSTILRGREPVQEKEYLTDAFARESVAFIDRHADRPFFLYLAFNAVHTPMHATDARLEKFQSIGDEKRRAYAAMLSAMDDAVGAVLAKLKEKQLEENTLVFFASDNGGPTSANASNNRPLHGYKASTWEGGVRVPFVVAWKGQLPAGKTYDLPVIQLDFFPTAVAAAGAKLPAKKLDGVNLLPHLKGETPAPPHAALYWRFGPQWAIRSGNHKVTMARDSGSPQLFDLAADIGESKDLSADQPELFQQLKDQWNAWNQELVPAKWNAPAAGGAKKAKAKAKKKGK